MIDILETVIFNSGDLTFLTENKMILLEKKEKKYFRSNIDNKELYKHITQAIALYLTDEKIQNVVSPIEYSEE